MLAKEVSMTGSMGIVDCDSSTTATTEIIIEAWRSDAQLYDLHCRNQDRLLVVRVNQRENLHWRWDSLNQSLEHRQPMENLLMPPGPVPRNRYRQVEQRLNSPQAHLDPMPPKVGAFIRTEKGVRLLTKDELARGLGIPKREEINLNVKCLHRSSALFHWGYLSRSLD